MHKHSGSIKIIAVYHHNRRKYQWHNYKGLITSLKLDGSLSKKKTFLFWKCKKTQHASLWYTLRVISIVQRVLCRKYCIIACVFSREYPDAILLLHNAYYNLWAGGYMAAAIRLRHAEDAVRLASCGTVLLVFLMLQCLWTLKILCSKYDKFCL